MADVDFLVLLRALLAWAAGGAALTCVIASGATMRLDHALYDFHMRHWTYHPSDDVVIVAIDPKSLSSLGPWPWPRAIHARLIDRLTDAGVRAVGVDIMMVEPDADHPENDRMLAGAMRRNGHVVMPVFAEPSELGGPLEETLPGPVIASAAKSFGHVDAADEEDGIVRGAFLKAGLGEPHWAALALAVYEMDASKPFVAPRTLRRPDPAAQSPYQWLRDDYIMLRFASPTGGFVQLSYVDVLEGNVPSALLKGRSVLVGATAEGLGDLLDTSASTGNGRMPGVGYQANLLESVRTGRLIAPLNFGYQLIVGVTVLALQWLLYRLPGCRHTVPAAALSLLFCMSLSFILLRAAGWWWPPTSTALVLVASAGIFPALARVRKQQHL